MLSGEIFKNFLQLHKNSLQVNTHKTIKNFLQKFSGVVVVGVWWCCGVVFNLFSCVCTHVYLYTIYIKYSYFMHIFWCLWCFMHYLCSIYTLYSTKNLQNSKCKTVFTETSNIAPYSSLYSHFLLQVFCGVLKSHSHLKFHMGVFNQLTIYVFWTPKKSKS